MLTSKRRWHNKRLEIVDNVTDYAIVGAGMTGLLLAKLLVEKTPQKTVRIFEKSKGCGGRMATRRVGPRTFDHGAQFIRTDAVSEPTLQWFQAAGLVNRFNFKGQNYFCAKAGMTKFAKLLAESRDLSYQTKIISMDRQDHKWILHDENSQHYFAQDVIVTSPLPQSLEILECSKLNYDQKLSLIKYAKAVVFLIDLTAEPGGMATHQQEINQDIFSASLQNAKGTSVQPAVTIVMTPEWSEAHFALPDEEKVKKALPIISSTIPGLAIEGIQVKNWRYSHPITTWNKEFYSVEANLYLAGDAFGGPSVLGAMRSAFSLAQEILRKA